MKGDSISARDSEALIAHVGWIRELARHMVADAHRADDLAQEACVIALEAQPQELLSVRSWLHTVMKNLVRQKHRGDSRRREREALVARAERIDATADLVERASLQRRIVEAVFELEEPYRSTILWRFFEDEPPREIARRLGLPVTTVQSRLKRGLQRLREQLLDQDDDRGAWLALLVPVAGRPNGPAAATLGGVIVNTKATLAVLSIVILATVVGIVRLTTAKDEPLAPAATVALAREAVAPDLLEDVRKIERESAGHVASTAADVLAPKVDAPATPAIALHRVRGKVIDAEGAALGGIVVVFDDEKGKVETRSGAGGWFELETEASSGSLISGEKRYATVRNGYYRASSSFEPVVIVAAAIDVGGSVLDPARVPVQGARISLVLPRGFETRFGQILESTQILHWSALTDASGRFLLPSLPQVAGSRLRVLVDGYKPAVEPEPEFSDPNLCFVLARPEVLAKGALKGRVLDRDGVRVPLARVAAGLTSTITDEHGDFVLDLSRAVTAERITAIKQGFRPATMERPDAPAGESTGWSDFIELRLGGPSLSIRGRVVDADDKPRSDMRVWIADPTPFGLIGKMPAQNENLMAGAEVPPRALEPDPNPPREDGDSVDMHRNAGGPPTACWYWVVTDKDGRFELAGLDDRKYTVKILDTKSLATLASEPIRAGVQDARIVVPTIPMFAKLAGRITTIGDRPVPGVGLTLRMTGFEVRTRYFGGTLEVLMMHAGDSTSTDAEGRFEFTNVPRDGVFFVLRSDEIMPCDWHIPADADPAHLDVHVDVRCQLEVRLKALVDRADSIAILDDHGDGVDLITMDRESVSMNSSVPLIAGRSGVLSTSSSARTLELLKDGKTIESYPIELVPGEINSIEH